MLKALVTGASSGIGRDIAKELAKRNIDIILVSRDLDKLKQVKDQIKNVNVEIISKDLSSEQNCIDLYEQVKEQKIDILINNAGFGAFGEFSEIPLEKELDMLKTNIIAMHILTKLFLQKMKKENSGYILNVASIAGYMPGPLMSAYYSSKAYVVRLTQSIREELRREKSNVKVGILCPGPVDTNFNNVAGVKFKMKPLSSEYVARYTVNRILKKKFYIIPGMQIKAVRILSKITPDTILAKIAYNVQVRKRWD